MSHITQEEKKALTPAIRAVAKKFNMKVTISIFRKHKLVVTVRSGAIRFNKNYIASYIFEQNAAAHGKEMQLFAKEMLEAMKTDNFEGNPGDDSSHTVLSYHRELKIGDQSNPYINTP